MFHGESATQFEQCLTVAVGQLVENRPAGGIGKGSEDEFRVGVHPITICK